MRKLNSRIPMCLPKPALLPCPFCGEDLFIEHEWRKVRGLTKRHAFRCFMCGASTGNFSDISLAAAAWNRRAAVSKGRDTNAAGQAGHSPAIRTTEGAHLCLEHLRKDGGENAAARDNDRGEAPNPGEGNTQPISTMSPDGGLDAIKNLPRPVSPALTRDQSALSFPGAGNAAAQNPGEGEGAGRA